MLNVKKRSGQNMISAIDQVKEIVKTLKGNILFGHDMLNNQVDNFNVATMQLRNYLNQLKDDCLVITAGDRADIILGSLQANRSKNYPKISGIILTGGLMPEESILKLIEGLSSIVPIISVKGGTFSVANEIGKIKSRIYAENIEKIETSIATFEKHVDTDKLANDLITFRSDIFTPRMFQYNLLQRALKDKKHIVLPEGDDERVLKAAARLIDAHVVEFSWTPVDLSFAEVLEYAGDIPLPPYIKRKTEKWYTKINRKMEAKMLQKIRKKHTKIYSELGLTERR